MSTNVKNKTLSTMLMRCLACYIVITNIYSTAVTDHFRQMERSAHSKTKQICVSNPKPNPHNLFFMVHKHCTQDSPVQFTVQEVQVQTHRLFGGMRL